MITVKRANVILDIPEEQKAEYLGRGFDVINAMGEVVEFTVPTDINTLKTAYSNHIKQIADLKSEIAKLNDEIKTLKAPKRKHKSNTKS